MEIKDIIQEKALLKFQSDNILLSWATGCGKSLATIKCIEKQIEIDNLNWYIVCWEIAHIQNWLDEFKKYNKEYLLSKIKIFCYASIKNYKTNESVNIVLDESHHITELSLRNLKSININRAIYLSATIDNNKKKILYKLTKFVEYHISLNTAIENKIIPEPTLYVYRIDLSNKEREEYEELDKKVNKNRSLHFALGQTWTEQLWLRSGLKRKNFMVECKTKYAKEILALIKEKRFICFSGSTAQSKVLGGKKIISSSITNNDEKILKFNKGKINSLFAVKMLREGVNLYNIEAGLIVQLDNTSGSFYQMCGRVFRSKFPVMFVIIINNTQDEIYLNKSMLGFEKYIKEYNGQTKEELFSN